VRFGSTFKYSLRRPSNWPNFLEETFALLPVFPTGESARRAARESPFTMRKEGLTRLADTFGTFGDFGTFASFRILNPDRPKVSVGLRRCWRCFRFSRML